MTTLLFAFLLAVPQGGITPEAVKDADRDLFAAATAASGPSVAALNRLARPFTGKAVVGAPFGMEEAAVTPAGAILAPLGKNRLWMRFFLADEEGFVPLFDGTKRSLPDARVPAVEHLAFRDDMRWKQTVYVAQELPGQDRLVIRLSCENRSGEHRILGPVLGFSILKTPPSPWEVRRAEPEPADLEPEFQHFAVGLPGGRHIAPLPRAIAYERGGLPEEWMRYRMTLAPQAIAPGESEEWVVTYPLYTEPLPRTAFDVDRSWEETKRLWSDRLYGLAEYSVPEPGFNNLRDMLVTQILLTADHDEMQYGAFPSVYDGAVFGVEEGWPILALAEWGLLEHAETLLDGTFLTVDMQDKANRHHQYRNGLQTMYAWRLYELSGDHVWLEIALLQFLDEAARWTKDRIEADPLGILPEYNYGGDISQPARALWPNAACWRGLRDTALAFERTGEAEKAKEYAAVAETYRARLLTAFGAAAGRSKLPPFFPLSLEESADHLPSPEYYQLFAPLILETGLLDPAGSEARDILAFLSHTGRLQAGVPRFISDGEAGLDAEYALGLQWARLERGERFDYLLGLFGQVALSCDPAVGTMPEVTPLLTTDEVAAKQREERERYFGASTEPCSAGPGVTLLYLRHMLVHEGRDATGRLDGTLEVCPAVPARWVLGKEPFYVRGLPTPYGRVSVEVQPGRTRVTYSVKVTGDAVEKLKRVRFRVPDRFRNARLTGSREVGRATGWIEAEPAEEARLVLDL